jgi:hypothetical protein
MIYTNKQRILAIILVINTTIFLLLSLLHFYWALGGRLWYADALPTNSNGLNRLHPSAASAFIIAFGLVFFALVTAGNSGIWNKPIKRKYFRYGALAIAVIFILRAIGDFKFIGFFKTITRTRFGINDTQIFSPLCLFIALLSFLAFILGRNYKV